MSKKTTTIAFDDRADAELEHLADDLQTSRAGIIRNALGLYAFLKRELSQPNRTLAILQNGQVQTRIAVPGLEVSQRRASNKQSPPPIVDQPH